MTVHASGTEAAYDVDGRIEALETVTVPAGTFQAYRIVLTDNFGVTDTPWAVPSQGRAVVRRIQVRPEGHPQGGAGRLEGVLAEVRKP